MRLCDLLRLGKVWSTDFFVGLSIMEGRKCNVSEIRPPPVSVMCVNGIYSGVALGRGTIH